MGTTATGPTLPLHPFTRASACRRLLRGGQAVYRTLDKHGFSKIEFSGEYPIGKVHYRGDENHPLPVEVALEA